MELFSPLLYECEAVAITSFLFYFTVSHCHCLTRQHYFQERLQSELPQHPAQYGIATSGTRKATNKASYDLAQSHSTSNAQRLAERAALVNNIRCVDGPGGPALKIIRKI